MWSEEKVMQPRRMHQRIKRRRSVQKRHGAIVKRCKREGCTNQAKNGGVCIRHGAKVRRCKHEGRNNVVVQGGVCKRHGAQVKLCGHEGCTNQARKKGGVCRRHGSKLTRCKHEGCTNKARNGGVCIRHGAKVNYAAMKDVQTRQGNKEEPVGDMEQGWYNEGCGMQKVVCI